MHFSGNLSRYSCLHLGSCIQEFLTKYLAIMFGEIFGKIFGIKDQIVTILCDISVSPKLLQTSGATYWPKIAFLKNGNALITSLELKHLELNSHVAFDYITKRFLNISNDNCNYFENPPNTLDCLGILIWSIYNQIK